MAAAIQIPGLQLDAEVGRGAHSVVYRALRGEQTFAVKVPREGRTDGALAGPFRREAALLACLRHPGLPAILEVGEAEGQPYIVMELVEGVTLAERLLQGSLTQGEIVRIASDVADALGEVHRHGLVHRDVKPKNILITPRGSSKLVDFGFAVRSSKPASDGHDLAGTLRYSAPEQSGAFERPIDGRADLYALGAVLFECAGGRPPFESRDPARLLEQHRSDPPPPLGPLRPDLSPSFGLIVEKLLAKEPDQRYQTAAGLLADLGRLAALDAELAASGLIALGSADHWTPAAHLTPIVGRDRELGVLRAIWRSAAAGRGAAALVEGEPGSGKTRLVEETVKLAVGAGALVLSGRCTDSELAPFAVLRQAVEAFIDWLEQAPGRTREGVGQWLRERSAAGEPALLDKLSTRLAAYLVPQGAPQPGGEEAPSSAHERFYEEVAAFLRSLVTAHPSGVLFLDDVQWIDEASLRVLKHLASGLGGLPLLIVATARSAAEYSGSVKRFLSALSGVEVSRIDVRPLSDEGVGQLISAQLAGQEVAPALVRQVAQRTGGSPLAVSVFVQAMIDAGLLRPSWGRWIADPAGMESLRLPSDVVQLVLRRVDRIGENARQVLYLAAVIGVRFSIDVLARAAGDGGVLVRAAVAEAAGIHLVDRAGHDEWVFVHDRVREAFLSELDAGRLRALHQRAAMALDAMGAERTEQVFALARHYALGEVDRDPRRVISANFAAGTRALAEYADEEARLFFEQARAIGLACGIDPDGALERSLGEVCARTGRTTEAIAHLENALRATSDRLAKGDLRARLALVRSSEGESSLAWGDIEAAFRDVGEPLPRSRTLRFVATIWDLALGLVSERLRRGRHRRARRASGDPGDQRDRVLARIFEVGTIVAFYNLDAGNTVQMTLRPLRVALRFGPSRELVNAYVNYAVSAAYLGRKNLSERFFAEAIEMARAIGDRSELARTLHCRAACESAIGDVLAAEAGHREALEDHARWLDPLYYLDGCASLGWSLMLRGYPAEAWRWIEKGLERSRAASGGRPAMQGHPLHPHASSALAVLGRLTEARAHLHRCRTIAEASPAERYRWAELLAHALIVHLEVGDVGEAIDGIAERHNLLRLAPDRAPIQLRHFWVYHAHARVWLCRKAGQNPAASRIDALKDAAASLRRAAGQVPILRAHSLLIDGSLAAIEGRTTAAEELLSRAEAVAREVDGAWVLCEAAYERARLLATAGRVSASKVQARVAVELASSSGRVVRARQIASELGVGEALASSSSSSWASVAGSSSSTVMNLQRHLSALLTVTLGTAKEAAADKQAAKALEAVVSMLRAERAYLLLCKERTEELVLQVGRDAAGNDLPLQSYSRTVVERVRDTRHPVLVNGVTEGAVLGSDSAITHGLRSIIAAPLLAGERLVGVVYLDNRVADGIFTQADVEILTAIGSHIALSLETVRLAQIGTYERVAAHVPGILFQLVRDEDGPEVFRFVSEGCREVFGVEPAKVTENAEVLFRLIHPEDQEQLRASMETSARNLAPWHWEGRFVRGEEIRWLELVASVGRQVHGGLLWDGFLQDVTARKEQEQVLERQRRELVRSNKDLEQFAYAASHDMQEPLRVVASYLQLIAKRYKGKLDADADEFIGYAVDGATRMNRMIRDLLEYSRVGTRGRRLEPTEMEEVVQTACENLKAAMDECGARVTFASLPSVVGDKTQLVQLFQNLIGNAIKFRRAEVPAIHVSAALEGDFWRISVADNGIGIEEAYRERIFGIFQRLHTYAEYPGSGVGLAICKRIVERHGGEIGLVSTYGQGTTFHFTLPTVQRASSEWKVPSTTAP